MAFNLLPNGGIDPLFLVEKIEISTQQAQRIYGDNEPHWVEEWSADGRFLLTHDTKTFSIIPVAGNSKPEALYSSSLIKDEFHLSPDGQLLAYSENRAGREILFLDLEGKMMSVTVERGSAPQIGTQGNFSQRD